MDAERLRRALWQPPWSSLEAVVRESASAPSTTAVYAVGGSIRDLLLERPPRDLDLVVVGDGLAFADRIGAALGVGVTSSRRFLTAELETPDGRRLDVSTARRETYRSPGALPDVEPAGIEEDLARRDFTVNTFGIGIAADAPPGILADPRAREDLEAGRLRVLHEGSFADDPTRILRGVALELRLGFRLEDTTERLAGTATVAAAIAAVSGQRIWQELAPMLGSDPVPALARLEDLRVLAAISPDLRFDEAARRRLEGALAVRRSLAAIEAREEEGDRAATALLALAWDLDVGARSRLAGRLALPNRYRRPLLGEAWSTGEWLRSTGSRRPSEIHAKLARLSLDELALVGWSAGDAGEDAVERELTEWRRVSLSVDAGDLLRRGVPSGPAIGRSLEATLRARLDGRIAADEELDYALGRVEGEGEEGTGERSR